MTKKMLIDATHAEETRVVVVDGNKVDEFDFESQQKRQLAGNIYLAKVTRVEPSLQAAFVDYGGNRHGFLAFSEIHPDYYQIPVADREALLAEEREYAEAMAAAAAKAEEEEEQKPKRGRRRRPAKAAVVESQDAVETREMDDAAVEGMETIDLSEEGSSPMMLVGETPVETPSADEGEGEQSDAAMEEVATEAEESPAAESTPEAEAEEAAPAEQDVEKNSDDSIESVAQEDDSEDVRPVRKPRPRRYKIQEVVKVRQILLIQVVKEERGNKGAALTTYLSLAGRYCVLMPNTARGGGISRKITNAVDRKKLKEIATTMEVPQGAGLIVRTAGAKRTKSEIKRDYEYLQRMWEQIRELTLKSSAPAAIYEEGDLIKRSIRDLYNREIDEIIVAGEAGYRNAKDTMKMIMPSHAKNVKRYNDPMPLYARYQVEAFMEGMFNPTVQLKSGGYLVIGITEALVAVDVNSGRATKEGSIEQTALNTNLEAAEEVARQMRLRDLAGLIVIDFIDMEERRNNLAVEKKLKDKLKTDRARIQVGRISGFGLLEMSRQRLRPGMLEATTQPCPSCHGTGLIRSDNSMGLTILRELDEEGVRRKSKEVLVKVPVEVANFMINEKREAIMQIEQRHGMSVRIEADPSLISPNYTIEKFKNATRVVPDATPLISSVDMSLMDSIDIEEDEDEVVEAAETLDVANEDEQPKKKRRRRRRKKSGGDEQQQGEDQPAEVSEGDDSADDAPKAEGDEEEKPKRRRRSRGRGRGKSAEAVTDGDAPAEAAEAASEDMTEASAKGEGEAEEKPKPKRTRRPRKKKSDEVAVVDAPVAEPTTAEPVEVIADKALEPAAAETQPEPVVEPTPGPVAEVTPEPVAEAAPEPVAEAPAPAAKPHQIGAPIVEDEAPKEKKSSRKGWWSLGRK
ncbi:MAG: Rne/Rng family ribonuclease [Planktomarina sp.]